MVLIEFKISTYLVNRIDFYVGPPVSETNLSPQLASYDVYPVALNDL